jgi:stage II sporulation protein P
MKRHIIIAICVLALVGAVVRFGSAFTFSGELSGDAALVLLRAENNSGTISLPSYSTLLTLGSPLLASLRIGEDKPPVTDAPSEPHGPSPPVMTPMLPSPSRNPTPSNDPSPEPSDEQQSIWDDRVWPQRGENDPGARPLREVTLLPVGPDGNWLTDGTVAVNNSTTFSIDIPAMLARESKLKATGGPQILIIHTHGSESFLPDERDFYIPTDIERTEDTRYNIVRLGDEIARRLEEDFGLTVLHDRTIYDFPTYSGSYGRALRSIEKYMEEHPGIQVVLDIHRDSISRDGVTFKTVCETSYGKTAQMMFVVGTSGTGRPHPNWRDNLAFAAQLQSRLLQAEPTSMRPIHLRRERFNQHAARGSLILEIGTAANTLTEALRAANFFCDALGPYLTELLVG